MLSLWRPVAGRGALPPVRLRLLTSLWRGCGAGEMEALGVQGDTVVMKPEEPSLLRSCSSGSVTLAKPLTVSVPRFPRLSSGRWGGSCTAERTKGPMSGAERACSSSPSGLRVCVFCVSLQEAGTPVWSRLCGHSSSEVRAAVPGCAGRSPAPGRAVAWASLWPQGFLASPPTPQSGDSLVTAPNPSFWQQHSACTARLRPSAHRVRARWLCTRVCQWHQRSAILPVLQVAAGTGPNPLPLPHLGAFARAWGSDSLPLIQSEISTS